MFKRLYGLRNHKVLKQIAKVYQLIEPRFRDYMTIMQNKHVYISSVTFYVLKTVFRKVKGTSWGIISYDNVYFEVLLRILVYTITMSPIL